MYMPWLGLGIVLALMLFQCNSMSIPDQSVTTGSSLSNSENENPLSVAFHQLTSGLKAVEAIVKMGMLQSPDPRQTGFTFFKLIVSLSELNEHKTKLAQLLEIPGLENDTEITALYELMGLLVDEACSTIQAKLEDEFSCTPTFWAKISTVKVVKDIQNLTKSYYEQYSDKEVESEDPVCWVQQNVSSVSNTTVAIIGTAYQNLYRNCTQ